MLTTFLSLLSACTTCPEGQMEDPLGNCLSEYEAPSSQEEALEALPDCELLPTSDRLDIEGGCADGACSEMTYSQINATLGEEGECGESTSDGLLCEWQQGALHFYFSDSDYDGVPDPDSESFGVFLEESWDGSSPDGLGIGISLRCYEEVLGEPEEIEYYHENESFWVTSFDYPSLGLYVSDQSWESSGDHPDGTVDDLTLFGAN